MKKLMLLIVILLAGCEKEPYIVGFVGTLTGTNSAIGIQEMYGVEMAVHNINEAGGINGREVVLEIRDDLNDPDIAVAMDNELKELGAIAIIGHSFSSVAVETVNNANENDILLISPSIGTDLLTGIDDNFIRLVPTATYEAYQITKRIVEEDSEKVLLVHDTFNSSLTGFHKEEYIRYMTELGLNPLEQGFESGSIDDYNDIISTIKEEGIESVFIVGSSLDSISLIQLAKTKGLDLSYHLSAWASSGDITTRLDDNVDDICFYNFFDSSFRDVYSGEINNQFEERYGLDITMVASYAYDAMYVLKDALENVDDISVEALIDYITTVGEQDGVQSSFSIDMYGDVQRDIYQFQLIDGEFVSKDN